MVSSKLAGMLPATRNQVDELTQLVREVLMAKIDDVLHHVAEKLDAAANRITGELDRLEQELRRGRPSPESLARVKASVKRLTEIVPEVEEEDHVGEGHEEGEEPEGEHEDGEHEAEEAEAEAEHH